MEIGPTVEKGRRGGKEGRGTAHNVQNALRIRKCGNLKDGLKRSPQRPARTLEPKKRGSSDSWKQHFVKNPFRVIVHFLPFLSFTNYLTFIQGEGTYFLV